MLAIKKKFEKRKFAREFSFLQIFSNGQHSVFQVTGRLRTRRLWQSLVKFPADSGRNSLVRKISWAHVNSSKSQPDSWHTGKRYMRWLPITVCAEILTARDFLPSPSQTPGTREKNYNSVCGECYCGQNYCRAGNTNSADNFPSQTNNNQYSTITNSRVALSITVKMGARVGIRIDMHR